MKTLTNLLIAVIIGTASVFAQSPQQDFEQNILKSASNYYAYPYLEAAEQQTVIEAVLEVL